MLDSYRSRVAGQAARVGLAALACACLSAFLGAGAAPKTSLVVAAVSDSQLVALDGNLHPLAQARFDSGAVPADLKMTDLELILRRAPARETALDQLIADQQNRSSTHYHRWLTPAEFGAAFGAGDADLGAATAWLESRGLTVGTVSSSRQRVPFSGTASQVEAAFHTQIHYFKISGTRHFSNVSEPEIPAALSPLVIGVRGLHDFHPKSLLKTPSLPKPRPEFSIYGYDLVGPADFATIYNLSPLYQDGIAGAGVSIAIVAQSDIETATPLTYWSAFGVSTAHSVTYLTPYGDPGKTNDNNEVEADLDVEIVGGLAPSAQLILVSSSDAFASAEYAIDENLAGILSMSFGQCEWFLGASGNTEVNADYQQAVTQGITVIVSSGDSGSAGCDSDSGTSSVYGLGINGLASTPYNVALGGTDFNPTLEQQGSYWSSTNDAATLESATSYIPEMVWNSSCANPVYIAAISPGNLDPIAFCNNSNEQRYLTASAASGGISSASFESIGGVYSGYPQPSWQAGVAGIQNYGARAIPDLSLQATDWAICVDNYNCAPQSGGVSIIGGTSAAAPAFAAIVALLDQTQISSTNPQGRQGLLNPMLYELAAGEYGTASSPNTSNLNACNSNLGASIGTNCIFYDITVGNNAVACEVSGYTGEPGSTSPTVCASEANDAYGVLELNGKPAYSSTVGYDLATGLGSLNAAKFVLGGIPLGAPSDLTGTMSGSTATLTWTADATAPQGATYNIYEGTSSGGEGATPVKTGVTATTTTITGLATAGQLYYFRVAATSGGKVSYPTNEIALESAPLAATGVHVTSTGDTFTVSWNAVAGAASYSIFFGSAPRGESASPDPAGISATSQSFAGSGGATYYLNLAAVNAGGPSPRSAEVSVTLVPLPPSQVYAGTPGTSSVTLGWRASYGAATYRLYQGTSSGGESGTPVQTGITGTSAVVSGLNPGQNYYFKVKASNAGGYSNYSAEARATMATGSASGPTESSFFQTVGSNSGSISGGTIETIQPPVANGDSTSDVEAPRPIATVQAASASLPAAAPAGGGGAVSLTEVFLGILVVTSKFLRRRSA